MAFSTLSQKVLALFSDRGWSQAQAAAILRMDRGHLNRILRERRPWTLPVIEVVARALDLTPEDLVEGFEEAQLVRPHGALIDRAEYERVAGELAQATARIRELEASLAGERTKADHARKAATDTGVSLERVTRERDAAIAQKSAAERSVADHARLRADAESAAAALRAEVEALRAAINEAHRLVTHNYEVWKQQSARADHLAKKLSESSGNLAAGTLFGGMLGFGVAALTKGKW